MLFLLNERVFDLGDPAQTLRQLGAQDPERQVPLSQIVTLGQDAAYASANFVTSHPDLALTIAALTALWTEANCALFVSPPRARGPREVGVQFVNAPLTTMVFLLNAQSEGRLTPSVINNSVWSLAPKAGAA